MTHSVTHLGPSDRPADADLLILHVESDESVRTEVATALTATGEDVDVVAVPSVEAAASLLADLRPDCLVVGTVATASFVEGVRPPVAVYSAVDAARVDERLLSAADTYVRRRSDGRPSFLARKAVSLAESGAGGGRTRAARARARSTAEDATGRETYQFVVADDGTAIWASDSFEAAFPVDTLATPPPDTGNFDARMRALLADAPEEIETVFRTKRGTDRCPPASVTVPTTDGEVTLVHSGYRLPAELGSHRLELFEDVTETVDRTARMELLETLVETSKDGLYTLDAEGDIEFCNATFADMLGYDVDDLVGCHASTVLADGELERGQSNIAALLDDGRDSATVDLTFRTRSGDALELSIHFTPFTDDKGRYAGLMGVARDITDRKRRERELKRYRRLVEAARDPMFVLDADGHVTLCNDAMERLVDADRLTGRLLTEQLDGQYGDSIGPLLEALRSGDAEWEQHDIRLTDHAGTERRYEATVGTLRDREGVVGTLRDVTERTRRTRELDLLKQVLGRVLRHNIRSQFTVIQSYADRLVDGDANPQVAGEAIRETSESLLGTSEKAGEIERLVDNDADRRPLALREVVDAAVDSVRSEHPDAAITVDLPDVSVTAHPSLELAVENAVENAVVHAQDPTVELTAEDGGETVELRIADDGPGIPETDLAAIEQREETPLRHTSGAGLWLIDWVVVRSGGSLAFDTGPDGTTVRVTLDRAGVGTVS
jgi:PAS domain S-box-containing protein